MRYVKAPTRQIEMLLTEEPPNKDTIISCLPTPAIAEEVFRAMAGGGTKTRPDRLVIDCSTIDPGTSRRICSMLEHAGIGTYIDTPMSGGVVGARAGTLSFMVGGSKGSFSRVSPILHKMGRSVVHCGAQGTGLSAKLANNYLLAINNLATAEAMNFGVEAGLEPSTLAGIINTATGRNWASEINNPVPGVVETAPASREYKGGFATALMDKDLKLAVAAAQGVQAALPLSAAALRVYGNLAADSDYAGLDFSVIYRYIKGKRNAKL